MKLKRKGFYLVLVPVALLLVASGTIALHISHREHFSTVQVTEDCEDCVVCKGVERNDDGFVIITFQNKCEFKVFINVCVRHESGATRHGSDAKPGETIQINLGKDVPDQTLIWTCDGSDPCEEG